MNIDLIMSPIHSLMEKINESSSRIISELDNENPAFDKISEELNQREQYVLKLGEFEKEYSASAFNEDELASLKEMFNSFTALNDTIQYKAKGMLKLQQEKLAEATKHRKADDSYHTAGNPKISYY